MDYKEKKEALADYAHEAWSGWMRYLFSKSTTPNNYGQVTIPAAMVERWKRQMETPYKDLPETEKESDRHEAEKILIAIGGNRDIASGDHFAQIESLQEENSQLRFMVENGLGPKDMENEI